MATIQASTKIRIRTLRQDQFRDVAELHQLALPQGFLSTLGTNTLSVLYEAISRSKTSTVLTAEDEAGMFLGFVSGTLDVRACYRHVLTSAGFSLFRATVRGSFDRGRLTRIAETLSYGFKKHDSPSAGSPLPNDLPRAELLSIAVNERARGQGVGSALVLALDDFFVSRGHVTAYRVTTDALDKNSNRFYLASGFNFVGKFEHHGHPMHMYLRHPSPGESA